MARVPLVPQAPVTGALLDPVMTTIGVDGVSLAQLSGVVLVVTNDSGGSVNLLTKGALNADGVALGDKSLAVPTGTVKALVRPQKHFGFLQSGVLWLNGTGLKIAAIQT